MPDDAPRPSGGDGAPVLDLAARPLARCPECLGASLHASDQPGTVVRCPRCDAPWCFEPPPLHVDLEGDLECLARWLPTIYGRAVSYDAQGGGSPRHGERPDAVDARHRDLRRALATLTRLDALERAAQKRHVRVLWFAYVLTGPELARRHKGGLPDLVGRQFASAEQRAHWKHHKTRVVKSVGPERYGLRLLNGAHAAYVSAMRGTLRRSTAGHLPPATVLHPALVGLVDRTMARSASPGAEDTGGEVANSDP